MVVEENQEKIENHIKNQRKLKENTKQIFLFF
jgi:hypothetical protein